MEGLGLTFISSLVLSNPLVPGISRSKDGGDWLAI